jgi:hypothetical protein
MLVILSLKQPLLNILAFAVTSWPVDWTWYFQRFSAFELYHLLIQPKRPYVSCPIPGNFRLNLWQQQLQPLLLLSEIEQPALEQRLLKFAAQSLALIFNQV